MLRCSEFDSDAALRAVFVVSDLAPAPPPSTDRRALIQHLRDPAKCSIGDLQRLWQDYGDPNVAFQILVTQCAGLGDLQACIAEQLVMEAIRRGNYAALMATMRQVEDDPYAVIKAAG